MSAALDTPVTVLGSDKAEMGRALDGLAGVFAGKTILVTGASGMLPAYIVHALGHLNATTIAHDPCAIVGLTRRLPVGPLRDIPGVRWLLQDARDPLPSDVGFDYAIVAASAAAPRKYLADPIGTLMANAQGLERVLERASEVEAHAVLYFSSGEIYGSPPNDACPTPEGFLGVSDPMAPRSCYVEGKRFGEALAGAYWRQRGLPVKIVRPFQVFGPGLQLDDGRAFADFLGASAKGDPIELRSAGGARRTYCYIADATVAFLKVLAYGEPGAVYNVGSEAPEVTILGLAQHIASIGGEGSKVTFAQRPSPDGEGSPARTCPSIKKIQRDLGWAPTTSLEEGIRRTLSWLRETT